PQGVWWRKQGPAARGWYTARVTTSNSNPPPAPDREEFGRAAAELLDLVRHLSGPEGCPWDREQTSQSLSPYLVEEAHEIGEAIARDDRKAVREELGDLLFLAVFLGVTLEREDGTKLREVVRGIIDKMIARHPHVFGERRDLDAQGVLRQWEEGKRREAGHESVLGRSPERLPALLQAYRVQEKAASVGFDWENVAGVIAKLREETDETESAIRSGNKERVAEEIGDLLFAAVNLARYLKTDPEAHLHRAIGKFRKRFDGVVERLRAEGKSPSEVGLRELDRLWEEVKLEERS
ncbi:MAG TPA: nucleoside triphosphate pyrophosphohydrolase, partial [Candidatus Dormibacteraeota bacterium]|nr:nucleoside triphosphate pyrophosphohydrolase [Candidatus Dormibacteraeota bacterium]